MLDSFVNKVVHFGLDNTVSKTMSGHFIAHNSDLSISTDGHYILAILYRDGKEVERKVIKSTDMARLLFDRLKSLHSNTEAESVKTISSWIDLRKEK